MVLRGWLLHRVRSGFVFNKPFHQAQSIPPDMAVGLGTSNVTRYFPEAVEHVNELSRWFQ